MKPTPLETIAQLKDMQDTVLIMSVGDLRTVMHEMLSEFQESLRDILKDEYLDSKAVCEYLHISSRTFQRYRDMRIIPFCQRGSTIYVKKSDLDAFQEQFLVKTRYQRSK